MSGLLPDLAPTLHRTPLDHSTHAVLYELVSPEGAILVSATLFDARYDSVVLEATLAALHPVEVPANRPQLALIDTTRGRGK